MYYAIIMIVAVIIGLIIIMDTIKRQKITFPKQKKSKNVVWLKGILYDVIGKDHKGFVIKRGDGLIFHRTLETIQRLGNNNCFLGI